MSNPDTTGDLPGEVADAVHRALVVCLPEIFPPSDAELYAGLDEKMTAYMKSFLAKEPSLIRTYIWAARHRQAQAAVRSSRREPTSVYFAQAVPSGLIKIGAASNVASRVAQLQTGSAEHLIVLGSLPGSTTVETALHQRFAHLRSRGEWFHPGDELLDYIGGLS